MISGHLRVRTNDVEAGDNEYRNEHRAGNISLGVFGLFGEIGRGFKSGEQQHPVEHAEQDTLPIRWRTVGVKTRGDVMNTAALDDDEDREDEHDRHRDHGQRQLHACRKHHTKEHDEGDEQQQEHVPGPVGQWLPVELAQNRVVNRAADHGQDARA